jgi:hypothetical protein
MKTPRIPGAERTADFGRTSSTTCAELLGRVKGPRDANDEDGHISEMPRPVCWAGHACDVPGCRFFSLDPFKASAPTQDTLTLEHKELDT